MENAAPSEMPGAAQGNREEDASWDPSDKSGKRAPSQASSSAPCQNSSTGKMCLLQGDSHRVNDRVLDLFSAGERRTVSQLSYKLSQPDFPQQEKRDLLNTKEQQNISGKRY